MKTYSSENNKTELATQCFILEI